MPFRLIASGTDTSAALAALADRPDAWTEQTWRQRFPGTAHADTQTVYLRHPHIVGPSLLSDMDAPPTAEWYRMQPLADLVRQVWTAVGAREIDAGRAMVVRLPPGGRIADHYDGGSYAKEFDRFHLVLDAGEGVRFTCRGQDREFRTGDLFWFDHRSNHSVANDSTRDRLHLIVDCKAPAYRALRKPQLRFAVETMAQVWDDMQPLLERHWREIAHYQDIPLEPDRQGYATAERNGNLRIFTLRRDDELIGYAVYFVRQNLHYKSSKQASQDILFLAPEYRRGRLGMHLIEFSDECLGDEGVQATYHHVKAAHNFGPLLERMGYQLVDLIYAKRLDKKG
jgi:GNAT superfamily N-acetyltransferase